MDLRGLENDIIYDFSEWLRTGLNPVEMDNYYLNLNQFDFCQSTHLNTGLWRFPEIKQLKISIYLYFIKELVNNKDDNIHKSKTLKSNGRQTNIDTCKLSDFFDFLKNCLYTGNGLMTYLYNFST